jgi:hypothetical protein
MGAKVRTQDAEHDVQLAKVQDRHLGDVTVCLEIIRWTEEKGEKRKK